VRGYEERTASGSMGMLASHEFRTPALSPTGQLSGALAGWDGGADLTDGDALQFEAFWDYGYVQDNRAAPRRAQRHRADERRPRRPLHARPLYRFARRRVAGSSSARPAHERPEASSSSPP